MDTNRETLVGRWRHHPTGGMAQITNWDGQFYTLVYEDGCSVTLWPSTLLCKWSVYPLRGSGKGVGSRGVGHCDGDSEFGVFDPPLGDHNG